ncbi:LON peptidase N-terminal domain and RING finger protein 1-like [Papaver somniferum]|uniref:LON peptidase N-terminal domain and RING finger protein 1-like n=1 Tax=Papaver somniferum TaxID=3469 RepID=UPI000E6F53F2|nr:LON peptidase N-terminal domain and RING finger protein 1-like [Papaver somniferum]
MATEEFQSPQHHKNVVHRDIIISPGFRSVAAMAGRDVEALLAASQVVEDTPERESLESQKRTNLASKTPQTNSRRIQRCSPVTNPALVLNLDDDDVEARVTCHDGPVAGKEPQIEFLKEERKQENKGRTEPKSEEMPPANLPCMDKLREELSCAICLEICCEPSTTPCGHSFCKKCLKSAADKCGKKCPKCRQLTGNGRSCIVNTSLWNTIQLLFPQEVEARKAVAAKNSREEVKDQSSVGEDSISRSPSGRTNSMMMTNPSNIRVSSSSRNQSGRSNFMEMNRVDSVRLSSSVRIRRARPSEAEDAALALR